MKELIERSVPFVLKHEGQRSPFEALVRAAHAQAPRFDPFLMLDDFLSSDGINDTVQNRQQWAAS